MFGQHASFGHEAANLANIKAHLDGCLIIENRDSVKAMLVHEVMIKLILIVLREIRALMRCLLTSTALDHLIMSNRSSSRRRVWSVSCWEI